ncbi:MAG: AAA family ATPase, partial [Jeotgalicoccus sp.]
MGKDIYVGDGRKEIIFQDIFNNIQNGDRVIMSETKSFHTLTDGLTVPEDGELEIVGRAGEDVIVSAGMTVYGQLILRNLTLDLSLTDANAGERIYVDGGTLILESVKIIGSTRTASPVMVNSGKVKMNSSTVKNNAEQSYGIELKHTSTGSVMNCNVDGFVVTDSTIGVYDSNVYNGVYIKEKATFEGGNTHFNFADAVNPRNIYCTDSTLILKYSSVTGDKIDNPIRAFGSDLYLIEMSMTNVRANGFALELNTGSVANISICKIRGVFAKSSTVQIDGDVTVYNFLELYDKSRITGADLKVYIAPPNYSMQVTEGSSVELEILNSRFSPVIKVDNSIFKVAESNVERDVINIDAIGNTDIEGDNINIRELDNAAKQQTSEEPDRNTMNTGSNALEELNEMIGLSEVKASVRKFINLTKVNKQKKERGLPARQSSLHSVYLGNPGTGKTTVARLVGQVLYQEGVLKSNKFVEVSRQDLVSGFIGKTSEITLEKLKEAHGGVFFVDEAYTLNSGGGSTNYGQEALDTILKYMEDNRDSIMIIFAGYTKEMYDFFNMNPGLKSRIPHYFNFEDYTQDELSEIGIKELKKEQYLFDETKYMKELKKNYKRGSDTSNARFVRNFNEALILEQSNRVAEAQLSESEDFLKIIEEDWNNALGVNEDESSKSLASIHRELDNLTGLESVKQFINKLIKEAQANKMFEERGMDIGSSSYHMVFTGPP